MMDGVSNFISNGKSSLPHSLNSNLRIEISNVDFIQEEMIFVVICCWTIDVNGKLTIKKIYSSIAAVIEARPCNSFI